MFVCGETNAELEHLVRDAANENIEDVTAARDEASHNESLKR